MSSNGVVTHFVFDATRHWKAFEQSSRREFGGVEVGGCCRARSLTIAVPA